MTRLIRSVYILLFLSVICLLESCMTARRINYLQKPDNVIPSYADTIPYEDYKIRKGDQLYIQVYSTDETTNQIFNGGMASQQMRQMENTSGGVSDLYVYKVDNEGNIRYPMIGKVQVLTLTARQTKQLLEKLLIPVIHNVSVDVQVTQRSFSIIGAMGEGKLTIPKEKLTIFEALAMAGDIAEFGDRGRVRIIRELPDGSTVVKMFDIRSEDIINSEFYYVEPNDVIYVQMLNEKIFGINSLGSAISVVTGTISFGVFIYTLINTYIVQPLK